MKQECIFYPNTDIIKEYYEYIDNKLVYMEEFNIDGIHSYALNNELKEFDLVIENGVKTEANSILRGIKGYSKESIFPCL